MRLNFRRAALAEDRFASAYWSICRDAYGRARGSRTLSGHTGGFWMKRYSPMHSALALAIVTLLSCTGDGAGSKGPGGAFPFSGPSCPSACGMCVQSSCSADEWCLQNQCADYFKCTCACASADGACKSACSAHATLECQGCRSGCFDDKCAQCTTGASGADSGARPIADGAAGNSVFPFTGPSCPTACGRCVQDHCANEAQCYVVDCSDVLTCACACGVGDVTCAANCASTVTSACMTCLNAASNCKSQNCSHCAGDAGFDSGVALGTDAGACEQLTACCFSLSDPILANMCANAALVGDPAGCQQSLATYQDGGLCP
jgi:hypothetical protein